MEPTPSPLHVSGHHPMPRPPSGKSRGSSARSGKRPVNGHRKIKSRSGARETKQPQRSGIPPPVATGRMPVRPGHGRRGGGFGAVGRGRRPQGGDSRAGASNAGTNGHDDAEGKDAPRRVRGQSSGYGQQQRGRSRSRSRARSRGRSSAARKSGASRASRASRASGADDPDLIVSPRSHGVKSAREAVTPDTTKPEADVPKSARARVEGNSGPSRGRTRTRGSSGSGAGKKRSLSRPAWGSRANIHKATPPRRMNAPLPPRQPGAVVHYSSPGRRRARNSQEGSITSPTSTSSKTKTPSVANREPSKTELQLKLVVAQRRIQVGGSTMWWVHSTVPTHRVVAVRVWWRCCPISGPAREAEASGGRPGRRLRRPGS